MSTLFPPGQKAQPGFPASADSALQLMAMRTELAALVDEWKAAGGSEPAAPE
jgi:hypothetical protein